MNTYGTDFYGCKVNNKSNTNQKRLIILISPCVAHSPAQNLRSKPLDSGLVVFDGHVFERAFELAHQLGIEFSIVGGFLGEHFFEHGLVSRRFLLKSQWIGPRRRGEPVKEQAFLQLGLAA